MLKWLLVNLAAVGLIAVVSVKIVSRLVPPSESFIRDRVVKLTSHKGQCTGEQVEAPSGETYILTAAHCKHIADKSGSMKVVLEDKTEIERKIIAESPKYDLLLLEGVPGLSGLKVSKSGRTKIAARVRTFTHGGGMDTYKTEGQHISYMPVEVPVGDESCAEFPRLPKYVEADIPSFFGIMVHGCILKQEVMVTSALVIPGSSGGPMVDASGELVGVVSISMNMTFSGMVPVDHVHEFIKGY